MNVVDILIILLAISSFVRGFRIGLVRQAGSTLGFIIGLFVGSFVANLVIPHITGSLNRSLVSLLIVLGTSLLFMTMGEVQGIRIKRRLQEHSIDRLDGSLGSIMAVVTVLLAAWLIGAILILAPEGSLQQSVKSSHIIARLDRSLPPATKVLTSLNKLIDPNGFPQVFAGLEPSPTTAANLPSLDALTSAVTADRASIIKVEGTGCGGIVEGSGFVITSDEIVTNAHVVAGVASPKVIDANGVHNSRVMWFDPSVDIAVLRVTNLAGKPLTLNTTAQTKGTPGAVVGYPGGGDFTVAPASVMDRFTAIGRDIYGRSVTQREVYSLQAKVIPGNSGGPLLATDGSVIGIVFATSTTYNNVGYALTINQVQTELTQAEHSTTTYSTGTCSE